MKTVTDSMYEALLALIATDSNLSAEIEEFFLGDKAIFEPNRIFRYVFMAPHCQNCGNSIQANFKPRDKSERLAVLAEPDRYGLLKEFV